MNAMLQHRGYTLLSAGHSVRYKFCKEQSILVMLGMYYLLKNSGMTLHQSMWEDFCGITVLMALIYVWYLYNRTRYNADALIDEYALTIDILNDIGGGGCLYF